MGKKIILDTNLYISALGWTGNPRKILEDVIAGKHELIISTKQLTEVKKVLDYPKLGFTAEQKQRLLSLISEFTILVKTKSIISVITEDPSDNIILEPIVEMKIDYLISGDWHLLKLNSFRGTRIVTAKEFLELT